MILTVEHHFSLDEIASRIQPRVNLSGAVLEKGTRTPLEDVEIGVGFVDPASDTALPLPPRVYMKKIGAFEGQRAIGEEIVSVTDSLGAFAFRSLPVCSVVITAVNPGYGTIYQSTRPVNKKQFRALLGSLPGSDDLDKEFVAMRLAGKEPPRDIPTDAELDAFAEAYSSVTELDKKYGTEPELVAAIEGAGLTIGRYNRLVDLVETYQSLENEVAFRLGTLERPSD